jgi:hypothetical protein
MSEQEVASVKVLKAPFDDFKAGDTIYVNPSEIVTTHDRKHWLSTNHAATGFPSEYRCAKVELHQYGVNVDWSSCRKFEKDYALKPGQNEEPPKESVPVLEIHDDVRLTGTARQFIGGPAFGEGERKVIPGVSGDKAQVDAQYINPAELFASPVDHKIWLSTRHDPAITFDSYFCARVAKADGGFAIDLSDCLQSSKAVRVSHLPSEEDDRYRAPVTIITGWKWSADAKARQEVIAQELPQDKN